EVWAAGGHRQTSPVTICRCHSLVCRRYSWQPDATQASTHLRGDDRCTATTSTSVRTASAPPDTAAATPSDRAMQETPAAAGGDTPGATTTRGVEAATAATVVAAVTAVTAVSSAPRARSDRAGRSAPRTPSAGAGRAAEDAGPDEDRRDDDAAGMSATAYSSSSRKAP